MNRRSRGWRCKSAMRIGGADEDSCIRGMNQQKKCANLHLPPDAPINGLTRAATPVVSASPYLTLMRPCLNQREGKEEDQPRRGLHRHGCAIARILPWSCRHPVPHQWRRTIWRPSRGPLQGDPRACSPCTSPGGTAAQTVGRPCASPVARR
jgi:hypothetical protein